MKSIIKLIVLFGIVCTLNTAKANLYKVENVQVAAERASALEAKEAALAEGQVVAFKRLITRLSPGSASQLPQMTEESVLPYVLGVSIENEKTTATKYMGSISVEFNPTAVKEFLNTEQVTYLKTQAPSLLVVPEYVVNGVTQTLEGTNPLYQALKEKRNFAPFYQAVVPNGTEEELRLTKQGTGAVATLLPTYGKEKVMILRLMHEGNDMWQISSSFYPSAGMNGQVVRKRFRFGSGDQKMAAAQMADAVFKDMENRWRSDRSSSLADKQTLYLRVPVDSLPEWLRLEQEMKTWTFFEEIALKGLFLPQILVEATYKGDEETIAQRLLEYGWRLNKDSTGNGATLVRVSAYE
ncbi:MAG: DUF2066 domain-containing protein [Alphaproteobacteria bacterium]|nr:DUF2066 domain-containing protein [Alphaproteobacteria bacterium]